MDEGRSKMCLGRNNIMVGVFQEVGRKGRFPGRLVVRVKSTLMEWDTVLQLKQGRC